VVTPEIVDLDESNLQASRADQDLDKSVPDENAQQGVRQAEAITLTWSKKSLAAAYLL
jgi:hypothetical protein